MNIILAIVLFPSIWGFASWAWALLRNYRTAKASGLPLVISPFNPTNIIYMLIKVPLRPILEKLFPFLPGVKLSILGWDFLYKYHPHTHHGHVFILVTPGQNELWCADPTMAQTILTRRRDFVQPPIVNKIMGFQGDNVVSSNGDSWARQRRLVAPLLNERISELVWRETWSQTSQMAESLFRGEESGDDNLNTLDGLRTIAINVLARVAYGRTIPFNFASPSEEEKEEPMTYTSAIFLCTQYIVAAALVPANILKLSIMPKFLHKVGEALEKLPGLTKGMLEDARRADQEKETEDSSPESPTAAANTNLNLMKMLVRHSDAARTTTHPAPDSKDQYLTQKPSQHLTESEIAGNLFIFTAAGFDTMATTLAYSVTLLAAHPSWQSWMQSEIDLELSALNMSPPDYTTLFPKLTRVQAVLLETLRLFPPVSPISKGTSPSTSQTLTTDGKSHVLHGPYTVLVNSAALHTLPSIWGGDSLVFRPDRWIITTTTPLPGKTANSLGETLLPPPGGPKQATFIPWSTGPRACPGMKMGQVEFVAAMVGLFGRGTVEPVVGEGEGETVEGARERLVGLMADSMTRMTLQMRRPGEVGLVWRRRDGRDSS